MVRILLFMIHMALFLGSLMFQVINNIPGQLLFVREDIQFRWWIMIIMLDGHQVQILLLKKEAQKLALFLVQGNQKHLILLYNNFIILLLLLFEFVYYGFCFLYKVSLFDSFFHDQMLSFNIIPYHNTLFFFTFSLFISFFQTNKLNTFI